MNGRSLLAFICVLFVIGIFWMIAAIPEGEPSRSSVKLFEPMTPVRGEPAVASQTTKPSEEKEAAPSKHETIPSSKRKKLAEEKPKLRIPEAVSDEPPELVAYTRAYGSVTFTHVTHVEDYGIDCGDCHHEDMQGGMSRCINCHEPPKRAFHKNCQGCHKQLENEGKDTGPTGCRECHIRKSS